MKRRKTKTDCLSAICELPRTYKSRHTASILRLYLESRYKDFHTTITQAEIENVIRDDPGLITEWLSFSSDKRTSPAWFFGVQPDRSWHVGFYGDDNYGPLIVSNDPTVACALMVRLEMEALRMRQLRSKRLSAPKTPFGTRELRLNQDK